MRSSLVHTDTHCSLHSPLADQDGVGSGSGLDQIARIWVHEIWATRPTEHIVELNRDHMKSTLLFSLTNSFVDVNCRVVFFFWTELQSRWVPKPYSIVFSKCSLHFNSLTIT